MFDSHILGAKEMSRLPWMQAASFDLGDIRGRNIRDLSNEITKQFEAERNGGSYFLAKTFCYTMTALTVSLLAIAVFELIFSKSYLPTLLRHMIIPIAGLWGWSVQFYCLHMDQIVPNKVYNNLHESEWVNQGKAVHAWYRNIQENQKALRTMDKRCQTLLTKPHNDNETIQIEASRQVIQQAQRRMEEALTQFRQLPAETQTYCMHCFA